MVILQFQSTAKRNLRCFCINLHILSFFLIYLPAFAFIYLLAFCVVQFSRETQLRFVFRLNYPFGLVFQISLLVF